MAIIPLPLVPAALAAASGLVAAAHYQSKVRGPFRPTRHVWSRGLALLCDHNGGVDFVRRQRGGRRTRPLNPSRFENVREGDLVWTRHTTLPQFVQEVLPRIQVPFALVTGDEDWSIPSGFDGAGDLLNHELLLHWFTQNADGTDTTGKVSPIPIGLDFHTLSNGRKLGQWPATPADQERELEGIVSKAPRNRFREPAVHADFHLNMHGGWNPARTEAHRVLAGNRRVVFQDRFVPRRELWRNRTRYAFVASPRGIGLDCHRTWESLALGSIVIVQTSPLDSLFEGLPVVIVEDWEEITEANLARWHSEHADAFDSPAVRERLTNGHWIRHMRAMVAERMEVGPNADHYRPIQ